jgi:hypothetical protein
MAACDDFKPLLMGLIDHELTPEETAKVNDHLIGCEVCRKEYDELVASGHVLGSVAFKEPEDEVLERLWRSPFSRFTTVSGMVLVAIGYLGLIGYGIYEFVNDRGEALLPKVALVAVVTGFVLLLFTVIRQRIKTYNVDRYKEIVR